MMYSLLLSATLALGAQEPERTWVPTPEPVEEAQPEDTPTLDPGLAAAMQVAQDLAADGDYEAARGVLHWALDQEPPDDLRIQLALRLADLPDLEERGRELGPTLRLVAWQGTLGTVMLGPVLYATEAMGWDERPYFATAMLGGGLGVGGALWLHNKHGLTSARSSTIMGVQQLALLDFAVAGYAIAEDDADVAVPAGLLLGTGVGTAIGTHWALKDPDPAAALAMQWGAWWGAGLGVAVMGYTYAFDTMYEDAIYPITLAANLGAVGGWALTRGLGATRQDVRMFNAGALVGGLGSYGFAWMTSNIVWYTEHGVVAFVTLSTVAGGAAGVALNRWMVTPPADRRLGRRKLASITPPTPPIVAHEGRALPGVLLTEVRF